LILRQIVRLKKKVIEYEEKSFAGRSLVFISTRGAAKVEPGARKMSATLKTRERRANGLPTAAKVFERDCRKHLNQKTIMATETATDRGRH